MSEFLSQLQVDIERIARFLRVSQPIIGGVSRRQTRAVYIRIITNRRHDDLAIHDTGTREGLRIENHSPQIVIVTNDGLVISLGNTADIDTHQGGLRHVNIEVHTIVVTVCPIVGIVRLVVTFEQTVLIEITERREVTDPVRTTRNIEIVLGLERSLAEDLLFPVHVREHDRVGIRAESLDQISPKQGVLPVVGHHLVMIKRMIIAIGHLRETHGLRYTDGRRQRDTGLTLLTTLGRHQNDTVGTPDTKYGRCRSVFKYRNTLDLVRIHTREGSFHTVDQNQRLRGGRIETTRTTDINLGVIGSGLAAVLHRRHTGQRSGHDIGDTGTGRFHQISPADRSNGTRNRHLFLRTVGDHLHILDGIGICLHSDRKLRFAVYGNLQGLIADIGNLKNIGRLRLDAELAVRIGRSSRLGIFDNDGCSGKRQVRLIDNDAFHGRGRIPLLRMTGCHTHRAEQNDRKEKQPSLSQKMIHILSN